MAKPYPGLNFGDGVDWKHVNHALLSKLNRLAVSTHQVITVTSGYRTYEQQAALYQRYIDSGKDIRYIAAPPGRSEHESGNAIDATVNGTAVGTYYTAAQLKKVGLSAPVSGDPVHIQLYGAGSHAATQAAQSGKDVSAGAQAADVQQSTNPRFFNTQPAHPSDIQANQGVTTGEVGGPQAQLANLWEQIANQQFTSPETAAFVQNSRMSVP